MTMLDKIIFRSLQIVGRWYMVSNPRWTLHIDIKYMLLYISDIVLNHFIQLNIIVDCYVTFR